MSDKESAIAFLRQAEEGLRSLMEKALADQRYGDVSSVAPLADGLSTLISPSVGDATKTVNRVAKKVANNGPAPALLKEGRRTTTNPKPSDFPKFRREGDKLVKLGWSKKNREVYEHRAPFDVVVAFFHSVTSKVEPQASFSMDEILPLTTEGGGEIPSYQAYMALAWLRERSVIESRGRDGYAVVNMNFDDAQLQNALKEIPTR